MASFVGNQENVKTHAHAEKALSTISGGTERELRCAGISKKQFFFNNTCNRSLLKLVSFKIGLFGHFLLLLF